MRYVPARVDADAARLFFRRRRWGNLFGLLTRDGPAHDKTPGTSAPLPCIERVWIPHYLVDFRVESRKGPGEISISLDACSGSFAIFQMHTDLEEGELVEDCLTPLIPEDVAIKQGRRQLLQAIMRRRGQYGKPIIKETLGLSTFYYPFWVYYFQRRGKYIDVHLQDACSAERGGNRTRQGVLNAFVAQHNTKDTS